jgi:hypothetical protein
MKKTYTTPVLIAAGDVVHETLMGTVNAPESQSPDINVLPGAGSVGYYL